MFQGRHNATNLLDNPLWQYAIKQYAAPECAHFLLNAQDEHHLDINILLFIGWISHQGLLLQHQDPLRKAKLWNRFCIRPIRAIRQKAKTTIPRPLYQRLKTFELRLEQQELMYLFECASNLRQCHSTENECLLKNLDVYQDKEMFTESWLQALKQHLQPSLD